MFNIGFGELLVILLIMLLLFGAKKLPEIASALGKAVKEFKKAASSSEEDAEKEKKEEKNTPNDK